MSQPNRLAQESSLYLRQHANNPVDWHPWGPAALEQARTQDRLIFLSIGYSACHWCHVMEHESFEKEEIGQLLNDHFVAIKVDREERPDLDRIYMSAVQLLNRGNGGWPMSVFLTPDMRPVFCGTYYPREQFARILQALAQMWQERRPELLAQAEQVTAHLNELTSAGETGAGGLQPQLLQNAVNQLRRVFDRTHGGFGSAPKFPHAVELRLLLRAWKRFGDDQALDMAKLTLTKMALGGIYDQLGGGFHRYSTDERWLAPHFEKMLYDNALLAQAYLEAHLATGDPFYRQIVDETLAYVLREMTSPEGAFWCTQDADSEGEEGKFFVWLPDEIETVLGPELAEVFNYVYDVSERGNWENQNILHRLKTDEQDAKMLGIGVDDLRLLLHDARTKLLAARGQRVWPGRDEKVLTAWNALMIATFAEAGQTLNEPKYTDAAVRAGEFILTNLHAADGRLYRTTSAGTKPKLNAYLEDYAYLINALVSLYEATFAPRWIEAAISLVDVMLAQFGDPAGPGFFFTGKDHEALITRVKDQHDGATPSGNSMAATALLRLGHLTGRTDLIDHGVATMGSALGLMQNSPMAAGQMLLALDFHLGPVQEFAVIGDRTSAETQRVLRAIFGAFRPAKVVAAQGPGEDQGAVVPLLKDRPNQGDVTTYICENFTCGAPLVGAAALENVLRK